nr:zinc finger protein 37-like isoform X6 [Nomia melanderi]
MIHKMESESAVMLESCGDDSILIQTVKNIVTEDVRAELESEEEEFFVVTDVEDAQQNIIEVCNEESAATENDERISWTNLCRICANTNDHLIPIFEGEGLQHDLSNKIHKYLPIHISETDVLPLQLCYHCAATLLAWHELLEGCLTAERRLLEMQDSLQEKQSSEGLEVSVDTTVSNVTESLHQEQETVKEEDCGEVAENDLNRCRDRPAGLDEKSNDRFAARMVSEAGPRDRVPVSDVRTAREDPRTISEKSSRPLKRTIEQRDELARAKVTNDGVMSYKCSDCGKTLSTSYNFLIHRNTHTGEKPYVCRVCDKGFRSGSGLNRHTRDVHAGVKRFACDICGRCLASKVSRDEHRRIHTGETPYVCETCGKLFKQKASLHVHRLFHSKRFSHRCPMCGRCFPRKQELDKHVHSHTAQRPFACEVCGERFRSKGCVSRHKRIHGGRTRPTALRDYQRLTIPRTARR